MIERLLALPMWGAGLDPMQRKRRKAQPQIYSIPPAKSSAVQRRTWKSKDSSATLGPASSSWWMFLVLISGFLAYSALMLLCSDALDLLPAPPLVHRPVCVCLQVF